MTDIATEHIESTSAPNLLRELKPTPLLPTITGGLITGLLQVVLAISYGALVYGGELSPFLAQGIGYTLIGAAISAVVITLFASVPGTVGSAQDVAVAIFSLISASIAAIMLPNASIEATFYTVVTMIALTTLLTGLFFFGLGKFRLGGLVRYLPYPVIGGFLAGTGWLLFLGGFSLISGNVHYSELLVSDVLIRWLPGVILAFIIFFSVKRFQSTYVLPGLILGSILLFYAIAYIAGYSLAELSELGWLLGPFPEDALWQPFTPAQITLADWSVISSQIPNIATVLLVSAVALLLNASGLELAAKQDVNLDKELQSTGISNVLCSISPGFVGFLQISVSTLNFGLKARNRMVGLIAAGIIGLTFVLGASFITYFPRVIMGSVLMFLGLSFLIEWAVQTWFTLPKIDFAIIWLILIIIATVGFLQGVAVGIVAAVIMFVISYSRTEVVRHELTGANYQSQVTRPPEQRQILDKQGDQLYILQLQGFIFFGTADRLFNQIKMRLTNTEQPRPRFVVLDFRRVPVLDSTGMLSFRKLKELTAVSHSHLIITAPTSEIQNQLEHGGLPDSDDLIHYFSTLDSGLEWCEDKILQEAGISLDETPPPLHDQLAAILPEASNLSVLIEQLEKQEIDPGITIITQGEAPDDLFFIEAGRVTTQLERSGRSSLRLETMRNGRVVGEIGFYLGQERTASVIADEKSTVYRLSMADLKQLERENPEAASVLHQIIIHLLAERVTHLVKTVNALQK